MLVASRKCVAGQSGTSQDGTVDKDARRTDGETGGMHARTHADTSVSTFASPFPT